jgi:predicted PurR-regulated permease PerM
MTDRERIAQLFFYGFLALMVYLLYGLLSSFLVAIAWAILLAFVAHPALVELNRLIKSRSVCALIITIAVALGVIMPAIWISERLAVEAQALYQALVTVVNHGGLKELNEWITHSRLAPVVERWMGRRLRIDQDAPRFLVQAVQFTSQYLLKNVASAARNVVGIVIDFGIVLLTFFYLLRDGEGYYDTIRVLTPLGEDYKEPIFDTLRATLSAVMRGLLLTALLQGAAIGLGLYFAGMPYWAFLAIVSAACGLLPFAGTALVWVPAAIYLGYTVGWAPAIGLGVWCAISLVVIDNFIKPLAMKHGTGLPTLALFFGIAGGLEAWGPIGIFAGPTIIAIFAAFMRVYGKGRGIEEQNP